MHVVSLDLYQLNELVTELVHRIHHLLQVTGQLFHLSFENRGSRRPSAPIRRIISLCGAILLIIRHEIFDSEVQALLLVLMLTVKIRLTILESKYMLLT